MSGVKIQTISFIWHDVSPSPFRYDMFSFVFKTHYVFSYRIVGQTDIQTDSQICCCTDENVKEKMVINGLTYYFTDKYGTRKYCFNYISLVITSNNYINF